ncbi:UDP-N-acetylmuramoyl-L-alanyl-D-glutamate--2,6-diaminopimelate ligase [Niallia sp. NCCP-28]|uniref:UDP-N-acetylmuramoyl-L-alanyl-D-glutamate--2, 6-diaminopimelate ligase n=1 Tax=Niallia sp. NCCP-28 TaxID=2934712 RepID=UPI002082F1A8|nr:UDP-N-acetylmuramoyl-L-alanyl-D-glutamate--2,6-diaminopimelate ligase [Niallia sp. NCCP-28]GKU82378.1 UDP-N-acetylmuramoyl-L-alanyl-D-glutamate--2,6-diaminopimelate ligase [Niallia sp. NCCP-28]
MQLKKLIESLQPYTVYDGEDIEIVSIENDNRKVTKGSLFICIKGFTVDGHQFAKQAYEAGAAAILAEKPLDFPIPVIVVKDTKKASSILADAFYEHPTKKLQLIGITGTNGKTTTSHLIEAILKEANQKTGIIGTMYTKINDEIQETKNTTPEPVTLQKIFYEMVEKEVETAVMEVSSHALVEGRVHGCDYDVAVFTNLSQDHLDFHGTMEEYKRAKGLLFTRLGNTFSQEKPKYAILNSDDPVSCEYEQQTAALVLTYGIDNEEADIRAKNIQIHALGTTFELETPFGEFPVSIKMIGKFNVYNVLASIAAGIAIRIPVSIIIKAIEKVEGVAGRFEAVYNGQNFAVIVDYSHTPDSLENALKTVKEFAKNDIYVIVGCGGDRDKTKRPLMAKIACEHATHAIFTSDNPRSEDPAQILKDMEEGVRGEKYILIEDRKEAIFYAVEQAKEGDVILIAGKGHETYQLIGSKVLDFDDRLVAKEAIEEQKK